MQYHEAPECFLILWVLSETSEIVHALSGMSLWDTFAVFRKESVSDLESMLCDSHLCSLNSFFLPSYKLHQSSIISSSPIFFLNHTCALLRREISRRFYTHCNEPFAV